jgi:hypothetical protein
MNFIHHNIIFFNIFLYKVHHLLFYHLHLLVYNENDSCCHLVVVSRVVNYKNFKVMFVVVVNSVIISWVIVIIISFIFNPLSIIIVIISLITRVNLIIKLIIDSNTKHYYYSYYNYYNYYNIFFSTIEVLNHSTFNHKDNTSLAINSINNHIIAHNNLFIMQVTMVIINLFLQLLKINLQLIVKDFFDQLLYFINFLKSLNFVRYYFLNLLHCHCCYSLNFNFQQQRLLI